MNAQDKDTDTKNSMDYFKLSDEEILDLVLTGDDFAQDVLYNRYKPLVIALSRGFFIKGANNDDLIQEGMIGLFKGVRSYDKTKGVLKSYLAECIKNQLADAIKTADRLKHSYLNDYVSFSSINADDGERGDERFSSNDLNPEEVLLLKENDGNFFDEFAEKLSPVELKILSLYLDGNSYSEIATTVDLSVKAVDNALQKIKKLAKKLYD
ncbi:MAG: sigma-70 family RNA polymerase sigma factor [Eubacteriales bacterium]|nr:sigma-70 family RNA polymerase sigma factor [Eubacteriales bacterium]